MSKKGIILWDHSGQTTPGMDISDLTTDKGVRFMAWLLPQIDKPDGGGFDDTSWPHPVTGIMGNSYMRCRPIEKERTNFVCAMAWIPALGAPAPAPIKK